jgi:hypothetical protein
MWHRTSPTNPDAEDPKMAHKTTKELKLNQTQFNQNMNFFLV